MFWPEFLNIIVIPTSYKENRFKESYSNKAQLYK